MQDTIHSTKASAGQDGALYNVSFDRDANIGDNRRITTSCRNVKARHSKEAEAIIRHDYKAYFPGNVKAVLA